MEMKAGYSVRDMTLCDSNHPPPIVKIMHFIVFAWHFLINAIVDLWDNIYMWIYSQRTMYHLTEEERRQLLEWVRSKSPGCCVMDLNNSWKDGIALVALVEGLIPNTSYSCSQYQILNPQNGQQNIELGFSLAKKYLGVTPKMTAEDFMKTGEKATERKIIRYITMLKLASAKRKMKSVLAIPRIAGLDEDTMFRGLACFAKGMGLMLAVKHRKAKFNIFLKESGNLDIVIEIKGPKDDFVSARITNRSPRNTKSRDSSPNMRNAKKNNKINIPFEYEILGKKVSVSYIPQSTGIHKLKIFWHGQHIHGSPYTVTVDDSTDFMSDIKPKIQHLHPESANKISILKSNSIGNKSPKMGRILNKRIIRTVVIRNGEEIELKDNVPLPRDIRAWASEKGISVDEDPQEADKLVEPKNSISPMKRSRTLIRDDSVDFGHNIPSAAKIPEILMDDIDETDLQPILKIEKDNQPIGESHLPKAGNVSILKQKQICIDSPIENLEISKESPKIRPEFKSASVNENNASSVKHSCIVNSIPCEQSGAELKQNSTENATSDAHFPTNLKEVTICEDQQNLNLKSETVLPYFTSDNRKQGYLFSASDNSKKIINNSDETSELYPNNSILDNEFSNSCSSEHYEKSNATLQPTNRKSSPLNKYPTLSVDEILTVTDDCQEDRLTKDISNWIANSMIAAHSPSTEISKKFNLSPISNSNMDITETFSNNFQNSEHNRIREVDIIEDSSFEEIRLRDTELNATGSGLTDLMENNISLISVSSAGWNDSSLSNFGIAYEEDCSHENINNNTKNYNNSCTAETNCEELNKMNLSCPDLEVSNSSLVKNKVDEWEKALAQINENMQLNEHTNKHQNVTQKRKLRNKLPWLEGKEESIKRRESSESPKKEQEPKFNKLQKWQITSTPADIDKSDGNVESDGSN